MKRSLSILLAAGALAAAVPAAAQGWTSINLRQAVLDQRIDMGVRNGALTRNEAEALRAEFRSVANLEARYRANGLTAAERADLDRRMDLLNGRIRMESTDRQQATFNGRPWQGINQRQAALDQRIDLGVRNGALTRNEAEQLRAEFRSIAAMENNYRVGGLSNAELADLDRRFDLLSARIRVESNDRQTAFYNGRPWQAINQRQAQLDQRIDVGVRNGSLTRGEAQRLRDEFRDLAALEARYRAGGLTNAEFADLDRRFDTLSARIRVESSDRQARGANDGRNWQNINQRQAQLDRRIDQGVNNGSLNRREAERLRTEFREIAAVEARYRANGLTARERADLDMRFDRLSAQIRMERADSNQYGRR